MLLARKSREITKICITVGLCFLIVLEIVGSFQYSVPAPVQSKQSITDPESPLPLPKTADLFQNPPNPATFSMFNASEVCKRDYNWSPTKFSNVSIDVPAYNSTNINTTFRVLNATLNSSLIVPEDGTTTVRDDLAQAFYVSTDAYLFALSIFVGGTQLHAKTMELRTPGIIGLPDGTNIANFTCDFGTKNVYQWWNISFSTPLNLSVGRYFVYMPTIIGANYKAWVYNEGPKLTTTYINDGTGWISAPSDLTLNVSLRAIVNPGDVNMTLESQEGVQFVENLGNGYGWANASKPIPTAVSQLEFNVSANNSIVFSYLCNATFSRYTSPEVCVSVEDAAPNWTLTLSLDDPLNPFYDYYANISGFQPDYDDDSIRVLSGSSGVAYTLDLDLGIIKLNSTADRILFDSLNYITGLEVAPEVYVGALTNIDVTVRALGNITLKIYIGTIMVHQDIKEGSGTINFQWDFDSEYSGECSIQVYFTRFNQAGANQTHVTVKKEAYLSVGGISIPALGNVTLQSHFTNISNIPIQGADVQFKVGNIEGTMNYASSGNYTYNLNLDSNALVPGTYDLSVTAITAGYRPLTQAVSFQVTPRAVNISLNPSARLVHPGETLLFTVSAQDAASGSFLLRPVTLILRVYPVGGNAAQDAIMVHTFTGVTLEDELAWTVPTGVDFGTYDVAVVVQSPYYAAENYVLSSRLTIDPPLNYLLYVGIVAGIVIVSTGAYVQRKKMETRASVKGLMILQKKGASVKERISPSFSNKDPLLVSGAILGMISLMQEITGGGLRSIVVQGGYIQFARGSSFWVITLLRRNPKWIKGRIFKMIADIEARFGKTIAEWQGENIADMDIGAIVKQHFGVTLEKPRELNYEQLSPPPDDGSAP